MHRRVRAWVHPDLPEGPVGPVRGVGPCSPRRVIAAPHDRRTTRAAPWVPDPPPTLCAPYVQPMRGGEGAGWNCPGRRAENLCKGRKGPRGWKGLSGQRSPSAVSLGRAASQSMKNQRKLLCFQNSVSDYALGQCPDRPGSVHPTSPFFRSIGSTCRLLTEDGLRLSGPRLRAGLMQISAMCHFWNFSLAKV